jgi:ATP-binding cassette subfamily F protein 3
MLQLVRIEKQYPNQVLFSGANLTVSPGERIGLVGPNGAGKTTLLRIIADLEPIDSGDVVLVKGTTIGYLRQDVTEDPHDSILEEVLSARPEVGKLERDLRRMAEEISLHPQDRERLDLYSKMQDQFLHLEGDRLEVKAKAILTGMGFPPSDHGRPVRSYSGGWMMRVALAKLLLKQPDLLLLDEPTNHLDLDAIAWLEQFLRDYRGTILMVSHDQMFLNRSVARIVEISGYRLNSYTGNYDDYLPQKAREQELLEARYENQQRRVDQIERFIERFRYKSGTLSRQVQSRIKMLERMERMELPEERVRRLSFRLPQPNRSHQQVATLAHVVKRYGTNTVFRDLSFSLERGQKIAVVGPNGAGKSTLLKVLAGVEPIQAGERKIGGNVSLYYYAQHQLDVLKPERTVLEELANAAPGFLPQELRNLAGMFLFSDEEVFKRIEVLSGGERARVALAKMLARPANFLVLDEPTNHLDILARQVLADVLSQFGGTLIMISHDRQLINTVANSVLEIQAGHLARYDGNYDYYRWKKEQEAKTFSADAPSLTNRGSNEIGTKRKVERRLRAQELQQRSRILRPLLSEQEVLETGIARLEQEKAELTAAILDPAIHADTVAYPAKLKRLRDLEAELEKQLARWGQIAQQVEETKGNPSSSP